MSKRDVLIHTASRLFCENGYHATGVAEILSAAGVAKGTLYQHFPSKESLIEEVLRRQGEDARVRFVSLVEQRASTARKRLLAVVEAHDELFWGNSGYRGCPFIRAVGEFSDRAHPLHRLASLYKRLITGYLRELARQAGADQPDDLAEQLTLLLEGAAVMHALADSGDVTRRAAQAARILIEAALADTPSNDKRRRAAVGQA
ncbi:MAG: TetR/AcrR family transcriptional regulator [Nitrospirota bacterium]|nr:TetR/AcrR family transcriptional regulator [Nitrospirota bacterium]